MDPRAQRHKESPSNTDQQRTTTNERNARRSIVSDAKTDPPLHPLYLLLICNMMQDVSHVLPPNSVLSHSEHMSAQGGNSFGMATSRTGGCRFPISIGNWLPTHQSSPRAFKLATANECCAAGEDSFAVRTLSELTVVDRGPRMAFKFKLRFARPGDDCQDVEHLSGSVVFTEKIFCGRCSC